MGAPGESRVGEGCGLVQADVRRLSLGSGVRVGWVRVGH